MKKNPLTKSEIISKIVSTAIFASITVYLLLLLLQGTVIVSPEYADSNRMISLLVVAIMALITIVYGIRPFVVPRMKPVQLVVGLGLLFLAQGFLLDQPEGGVYAEDLLKVVGIALILLTPTHVLSPQSLVEQKKEDKIEIIEV